MEEIKQDPQRVERAMLIGVQENNMNAREAQDHLDELASLTQTLGIPMVHHELVRIAKPQPHFLMGEGKAEEIKALAKGLDADVLIFDTDLSPSQQRNWEKFTEICVIDRQEVILDIFAERAHTREARLQVGLARMEYSLPRLKRAWTHLERQRGGTGLRGGAGELQLEVDRRIVKDRITRIRRELKEVQKQRQLQRKTRQTRPVPTAAIVGYTNVGKSSLLRRLSGAEVFVEDKLFATLDTTTRRIVLGNNQPLLLTDTVGFIRKLPHGLVEAFKSTLEEAVEADFLIHVLDISHPKIDEHYRVTNEVLDELGAGDKPTIIALNKIDREYDATVPMQFRRLNGLSVPISTHTGEGIDTLMDMLARHFTLPLRRFQLLIPPNRYDLVNLLHTEGEVSLEEYEPEGVRMEVTLPTRFASQVEAFQIVPS